MNAQQAEVAPGPRATRSAYTQIPNAVIDDTTLDVYEHRVYEVIRRRDWHGEGWVLTFDELTAAVGCKHDKLRRSLRALAGRGLVRWEGIAKRPKRYFALVPAAPADVRGPAGESLSGRDRIASGARSPGVPIALGKRSNRFGEAIESLSDGDASIYHRPSQTITDEEGSLSAEISTPRAEHTRTAPSVCDQAVETITAAIIAARCSTVACERAAGRLGGLTAGVRQHIVTPLAGDPRQITTGKVVHCIAYLRSKPHITPTMITPRTVADELGPWLAAGEPLRFEPPPREHALASGRMSTRHGADWGRSTTRASTLAAEAARRDRDFEECKAKHLARYGHLNGFE